jgi:hypothetical protein
MLTESQPVSGIISFQPRAEMARESQARQDR